MRAIRKILSRLRCCHWLTWSVALPTALALVLIVAPGEYVDALRRQCTTEWEEECKEFYVSTHDRHQQPVRNGIQPDVTVRVFEHGWPRPFLARALVLKQDPSGRPHRVS